jgi:hypothetical protein
MRRRGHPRGPLSVSGDQPIGEIAQPGERVRVVRLWIRSRLAQSIEDFPVTRASDSSIARRIVACTPSSMVLVGLATILVGMNVAG